MTSDRACSPHDSFWRHLTLTRVTRGLVALGLTLAIAACATAPAADIQLPPKKQLDAKTQLESGRRY